ncbi:Basal-body rod modification protein FlgD [Pseudovibrio axinellae]|uniref:Basal-body rod modification protein FlgD n=1 Tax=Pseudovibrio axinellae TaxID=989403 RepID=A0A165XJG0_9HYPH|nr:flagellar hook capping FlgD N-terminal domain-containing protein [Pseudovibrio axinellae]KZL17763.1 Basal-body rod modification protein FlgD [Pseudovibrio axinellae]SEP73602.1 flagellar basal-body rod modification protein FlgD [Pseudovibrio axinellae]
MAVEAVTSTTSTPSDEPVFAADAGEQAYLDYNAFLMLFMESLKSQDPTDPLDTAEYMGQLAQFSSVEQATKTNTNLAAMLQQQSINQANNLIGATITVPSPDGEGEPVVGIIQTVQILTDGSIATLEDGTKVALIPGIEISRPVATDETVAEVDGETEGETEGEGETDSEASA